MRPFEIAVPDAVLDDLRERLHRTRWPDESDGAGWSCGTDLGYMKALAAHWLDRFDWRAIEARLNAFPQHVVEIDGLTIHFVHARSRRVDALPLVVTHGWPSTFVELLPLVPRLTESGFDLVIPSLPGFAFSGPHTRRGPRRTHDVWARLMSVLGYERFGACGSDVGARVTSRLAWYHRERVAAIHLSSVDLEWPDPLPDDLTPEEGQYVTRVRRWEREEGAYADIQATRPQTLAYGLADSPVGLAAWMAEKFRAWSDCGGDIARRFSFDEVLTAATIYWVTGTMNSANRYYYESRHDPAPLRLPPGTRIEVPTGIAMFPGERELLVPRSFAERCYRVERWTEPARGGHFAALEEPELLAADIVAFFERYR